MRVLSFILTLAAIFFAYRYGANLIRQESLKNLDIDAGLLVLSAGLFLLFYILLSVHWLRVCRLVDGEASGRQALAFFASQPYKYLPTSIFTFSYRAVFAKQAGLPLKKSSLAQLIENGSIVASGLLVALVVYLASVNIAALIILLLFLIIIYLVIPKELNLRLRRYITVQSKTDLSQVFGLACLSWLVSGFSFLAVSGALGISLDPIIAIAANSAAYVLGILAVFAPGGIGIREVVLAFFSISGAAIIAWRLLTFIGDMVFGTAAILILRQKSGD